MAGVKRNISTRLAIEGEAEYKAKLSAINSEHKTLASALKLVESEFAGQANTMAALTAKGSALKNVYDSQAQKVKELGAALKNAQESQATYASRVEAAKSKIAAADAEMDKLKNSTGDTTDAQKKLAAELDKLQKELQEATRYEDAASKGINDWQRQVNNAQVELNDLDRELVKNNSYLDEAKRSTDGCATSIDRMGKESAEAAKQGGLLSKIFAGGFLANMATQALNGLVRKIKRICDCRTPVGLRSGRSTKRR